MEDRIRKMPEKVLDIAVFILFAVFAICPLVNFLIVCVEGLPDYSWGFVHMPNPVWELWNSYVLYFGIAICLLYWLKAYLRKAAPLSAIWSPPPWEIRCGIPRRLRLSCWDWDTGRKPE